MANLAHLKSAVFLPQSVSQASKLGDLSMNWVEKKVMYLIRRKQTVFGTGARVWLAELIERNLSAKVNICWRQVLRDLWSNWKYAVVRPNSSVFFEHGQN